MIHVGMDVHARNSLLNAKDAPGQVLTPGCCGNTMFDRSTFFGPLARRAQASGEAIPILMESTTNSRAIQRLLTQYGREAGVDLTGEVLQARKLRISPEFPSVGSTGLGRYRVRFRLFLDKPFPNPLHRRHGARSIL